MALKITNLKEVFKGYKNIFPIENDMKIIDILRKRGTQKPSENVSDYK